MKENSGTRRVSVDDLRRFSLQVFEKVGATYENAMTVSEHLVEASLRGIDSHGISRIPVYLSGVIAGDIDPKASPEIERETSATALIDGRKSFGQVAALYGVRIAASKAKKEGISAVGVKNLNHIGMLGYYGGWLAENGLIGKLCTNGMSRVAPWGGKKKIFGTNPICFAFPMKDRAPLVIDISTAVTAAFKLVLASKSTESIPIGWAVGPDGSPATDPASALKGALLPMAGHKGYGLSFSVELMSSALVGAPSSIKVKPIPYTQGGLYIESTSINIFRDAQEYFRETEELVQQVKNCPLAKGFDIIYLPGEPETRERARRLAGGVPIANSIWEDLKEVSKQLSVHLPSLT